MSLLRKLPGDTCHLSKDVNTERERRGARDMLYQHENDKGTPPEAEGTALEGWAITKRPLSGHEQGAARGLQRDISTGKQTHDDRVNIIKSLIT